MQNLFKVFPTFPGDDGTVADRLNAFLAENPHLRVASAYPIQVQKIGEAEAQLLVEFEEK